MNHPDAVLQYVGQNIRFYRNQHLLSQQELAERSGVSRRTIASLETGMVNISLTKLDAIANALNVNFKQLVTAPELVDSAIVKTLAWQGSHLESQATLQASIPARTQVELWTWTLVVGETYVAEPDQQGWQELIYVIEGELSLEFASRTHLVAAGTSFLFDSSVPYRYSNQGNDILRFIRNVIY